MQIFLENLNNLITKETFVIISVGYMETNYKNIKLEESGHMCVASRNKIKNKICVTPWFEDSFVHDFFIYSPEHEIIIDLNNEANHNNLHLINSIQLIKYS
jgi:hypothetical protein